MNFKSWQHWRWNGGGRKETPSEKEIKKIHSGAEKDKYDCPGPSGVSVSK